MENRRNFIKKSSIYGLGLSVAPGMVFKKRDKKVTEKLRLGFIGVGLRGTNHLHNALSRSDVEVVAVCDVDPNRLSIAGKMMEEAGHKLAKTFGKDELDYLRMLEMKDLDAVIISTPWLWHTRMATDAMKAGKYTGVEVSAANTMEECWDLVKTHERTGSHLMLLENVCFRRDIMAVMNMVRQGIFGELLHMRCGYQHDLRFVKLNDGKTPYGLGVEFGDKGISESKWRTRHSLKRNADLYPTHGVGPIATMLDINRGNRFMTITSHATKTRGLHNYIVRHGGTHHPNASLKFKLGDIVTSTIETANGETIIVTHDTNSPRPYSLGFRVQGTKGIWEVDGHRIYIEDQSKPHHWDQDDSWLDRFDHPLWKKYGAQATGAGHGGMDYFVMKAFVESALQNIAPPIDAYDAAAWSAITPLSERSIEHHGMPMDFPDFTKGRWIKRDRYDWLKDRY